MSRSQILIRNTLYNYFSSIWFLILHFFATPYIVNKLGMDAYGIYSIVLIVSGYFGFLELGFGKASIKFIASTYAENDFKTIGKIIGSAKYVYLIMGLIGAALIALMTNIFVTQIFKISSNLIDTAKVVFYVSAAGFFINIQCSFLSSIPKALQRFDIINKIRIIIGSMQIIISVILLYFGYFLDVLIISNVFLSLLTMIIYYVLAKKLLPQVEFKQNFDLTIFKEMGKFGIMVAGDNIFVMLSRRINCFFIGVFHPISYITYYVIPENIVSKIAFIPHGITQTIFPSFSELYVISKELLNDLYIRSTKYVVLFTMPFLIFFLLFSRKFLFYWMGSEVADKGTVIMQIMGVAFLLNFWAYTSVAGSRSINRPDISTKLQALLAVINILLCIILIPHLGILGAALAWSLHRFILIPLFIYIVSSKLLNIPLVRIWEDCFKKPIILVIIMLPFAFFMLPSINSLYILIICFFLLSTIYFTLSYLFILDITDKNAIIKYIKNNFNLVYNLR